LFAQAKNVNREKLHMTLRDKIENILNQLVPISEVLSDQCPSGRRSGREHKKGTGWEWQLQLFEPCAAVFTPQGGLRLIGIEWNAMRAAILAAL
jgi:hypothetical protein